MRTLILAALIALASTPAHAALGDHQWSNGWGSGGFADADGSGHVAAAGTIFGPVDFGGGTFNPVNFLGGDVFLARFDDAGNHVWSQQITPGGFGFLMQAMCTGPDGSIYLAGNIQNGDIDFGGGLIAGNNEVIVAGFNADGSHRFSFKAGPCTIRDMDASNGAVALAGYTNGTVDFGGGALASAGGTDALLAVLTTAGAHVFSDVYGDTGDQGAMSVALDAADGAVLAGTALSSVDFGGGGLSVGTGAAFLAAFDSGGAHQWSQAFEGDYSPGAGILAEMHLALTGVDGVVWAGQYVGTVNLGGADLTAIGQADVFLARYDATGTHLSSVSYGGNKSEAAQGVCVDGDDNVFVAGTFISDSADFGGAAPLVYSGGFNTDFFVTAFDAGGANLWITSFVGDGQNLIAPAVATDGKILLSGNAWANTDFGGGPVTETGLFLAMFEGAGGTTVAAPDAARTLHLGQNAPNPFNPSTTISFRTDVPGHVALEVFDVSGRHVRTLHSGPLDAGAHQVVFDGRDDGGRALASGVYRYRLHGSGPAQARSMVLVK